MAVVDFLGGPWDDQTRVLPDSMGLPIKIKTTRPNMAKDPKPDDLVGVQTGVYILEDVDSTTYYWYGWI